MQMRRLVILITAVTLSTLIAANAQLVRGAVVEDTSGAPVTGAFLLLVNEQGVRRAAVLTDSAGEYIIRAPEPGRYVLKAERIGYATVTSARLNLEAGRTLVYRFQVPVQAINLEGIAVTGEGRCHLSSEEGVRTSALWEEGRKALSVVAWLEDERGMPYQVTVYERTRDLLSLEITENRRRIQSGVGRTPFGSRPAAELAEEGYVRRAGDEAYEYLGPDAQVLLSDDFLATHCFRIRNGREGLIGLAFEPVRRESLPDISGVLWFRASTLDLAHVEFTYTRFLLPVSVPPGPFGGRVEFQRLANGAWVVNRWWIRMPNFVGPIRIKTDPHVRSRILTSRDAIAAAANSGMQIHEEGGWMLTSSDARPELGEGGTSLRGFVFDSTRSRPVPNATVFLLGEWKVAQADPLGSFWIHGVSAGEHRIAFLSARTDSLLLVAMPQTITVGTNTPDIVRLSVQSSRACSQSRGLGGVIGFIDAADSGEPLAGASVRGAWQDGGVGREVVTTTDGSGRFLICGIPIGASVRLSTGRRQFDVLIREGPEPVHFDLIGGSEHR